MKLIATLFAPFVSRTGTRASGALLAMAVAGSMVLAAGQASAQVIRTDEPDFLVIGAGAFDINDDQTAGEFDVQFRVNTPLWIFRPQVGMFVTTDSAFYAYAGLYTDLHLGDQFVLSPSFSVGGFHEGDGKDLGGALEFRSAIELAYKFESKARLGVQIGHLSNASIYDSNPGEEFILLNFSLPVTVFDR